MAHIEKILDRMAETLTQQGYSANTEHAFVYWARAFLEHFPDRTAESPGQAEVETFLDYLIRERFAPAAIQNQALQALLLLFRDVLKSPADWLSELIEARSREGHRHLVSPDDVRLLMNQLDGQAWLAAALIYGGGLRLAEFVSLRVVDVDIKQHRISVLHEDGSTRFTLLPHAAKPALRHHLQNRQLIHLRKVAEGDGLEKVEGQGSRRVPVRSMPWAEQFLFVNSREFRQVEQGFKALMHRLDLAIRKAAIEAGLYQMVNATTLRNSFAMEMLKQGAPKPWVAHLLGMDNGNPDEMPRSDLRLYSPLDLALDRPPESTRVNIGQFSSNSAVCRDAAVSRIEQAN